MIARENWSGKKTRIMQHVNSIERIRFLGMSHYRLDRLGNAIMTSSLKKEKKRKTKKYDKLALLAIIYF